MTITRAKVDVTVPRKRRGDCSQHEKGLNKFYDQVVQAILRFAPLHLNLFTSADILTSTWPRWC